MMYVVKTFSNSIFHVMVMCRHLWSRDAREIQGFGGGQMEQGEVRKASENDLGKFQGRNYHGQNSSILLSKKNSPSN